MSTFKKLDRRDIYTTHHLASKAFSDSSETSTYGVQFLESTSGPLPILQPDRQDSIANLQYLSIIQLYFSNFVNDKSTITGSFENYLQSSLFTSGSRNLLTNAAVVSYPRASVGEGLKPSTVTFSLSGLGLYIVDQSDYVLDTVEAGGAYVVDEGNGDGTIKDDGEGRLKLESGTLFDLEVGDFVGNVIYPHGLAIFTAESTVSYFVNPSSLDLNWNSLQTIYTLNVKCKVRDEELNYSTNPTTITGENGTIASNLTGSEFTPYVTTIGLYNDYNELIAVGKLGQPVPKSTDTDMTFEIKLDI